MSLKCSATGLAGNRLYRDATWINETFLLFFTDAKDRWKSAEMSDSPWFVQPASDPPSPDPGLQILHPLTPRLLTLWGPNLLRVPADSSRPTMHATHDLLSLSLSGEGLTRPHRRIYRSLWSSSTFYHIKHCVTSHLIKEGRTEGEGQREKETERHDTLPPNCITVLL